MRSKHTRVITVFAALFVWAASAFAQATLVDLGTAAVQSGPWGPEQLAAPATVLVYSEADIVASGAANLADLVDQVSGLDARDYGYPGSVRTASIRGSSGAHVVVVVDGVRLNDPRVGTVDLAAISMAGVESIQIIRNGASALYGADAIAGVIYITTKRQGQPWFNARLGTGLHPLATALGLSSLMPTQSLSVGAGRNLAGLDLSLATTVERASGQFPVLQTGSLMALENTGLLAVGLDLGARAGFLTGIATLALHGSYADRGIPGSLSYPTPEAAQQNSGGRVSLAWTKDDILDGALAVETLVFGRWDRVDYSAATSATLDRHDAATAGIDLRASGLAGPVLLRGGLSGELTGVESTSIGTVGRIGFGVYAVPELQLGDLTVSLNGRLDLTDDFGLGFGGGFGLSWRDGFFSLALNGAQAYRAPSFNDLYWPDEGWGRGNPALQPETAWSAELVATFELPFLKASATPNVRFVKDLINWVDADGWLGPEPMVPLNLGAALYYGGEARLEFDQGVIEAELGYVWLEARNLTDSVDLINAPRLPLLPRHSLNGFVWFRQASWRIGLTGAWKGGRVDSSAFSLDDIVLLGAACRVSLGQGWSLALDADNLLNAEYQENPGYPQSGLKLDLALACRL